MSLNEKEIQLSLTMDRIAYSLC